MNELSFDCHCFLDNKTLSLLEISTNTNSAEGPLKTYHWILIEKSFLKVTKLQLKTRDDSNTVHERFFDIGYLKYDLSTGVFICQSNEALHPLEKTTCNDVPETILKAVENYLSTNQNQILDSIIPSDR